MNECKPKKNITILGIKLAGLQNGKKINRQKCKKSSIIVSRHSVFWHLLAICYAWLCRQSKAKVKNKFTTMMPNCVFIWVLAITIFTFRYIWFRYNILSSECSNDGSWYGQSFCNDQTCRSAASISKEYKNRRTYHDRRTRSNEHVSSAFNRFQGIRSVE